MKTPKDEQRVSLTLWLGNGNPVWHDGQGKGLPEVSIGRTNSKLGLGFVVSDAETGEDVAFVLDRPQVENLHAYLGGQIRRLKKTKWTTIKLARLAKRRRARARRGA
jgi:hypothetical protein